MGGLKITSLGPALDDSALDAFQHELGLVLPADYRAFLLKANGATVEPDTIDIPGMPQLGTDVRALFGIGIDEPSYDLGWFAEAKPDLLAMDLLPIGIDSSGCVFCLDIEKSPPTVCYVDLTWEYTQGNIYRVAESLDAFLAKIRSSVD